MENISNITKDTQVFLESVTGSFATPITFQTFGDKNKKDPKLIKVFHGPTNKHITTLLRLNEKHAGIFFMVNEGDSQGRSTENVTRVRAVFADFDGTSHFEAVGLLKPHLVVESSPGKYHVYWVVSDCSFDQFSEIQKAIARRFNSDPSVHDLPRVMRLPGFYHHKSDEPFLVRISQRNDITSYTISDVIGGLGLFLAESLPSAQSAINHSVENNSEVTSVGGSVVTDLSVWAMEHPDFLIANAIKNFSPRRLIGTLKDNKQHIQCPFCLEHSDPSDDKATFCINGTETSTEGFVIKCLHAHCSERDRLDFIKEMIRQSWFPAEALTDKQFLAKKIKPKWIKYGVDSLNCCVKFNSLTQYEQTIFRALQMLCLTRGEGAIRDDSWLIYRQLGILEDEWEKYRSLFVRAGLIIEVDGFLIHRETLDMYTKSQTLYEKKSRGGIRGGKSKGNSGLGDR